MKKLSHAPWCATETGSGSCDCAGHEQGHAGVYILFQKDKPVYVGETSNFKARLQSHSYAKRFQIGKIAFKAVEDRSRRLATERELIEQLDPTYNGQRHQSRDVMTGRFAKEQP
jgi:excinuclease UvrABC nuclease subunit